MLSQRSIQLWEGYSSGGLACRESHVEIKRAASSWAPLREWKALYLRRRRRVRVSGGRRTGRVVSVVVCSQGIQAAPVEPQSKQDKNSQDFVRATNGGASQLRLDGDDVRIGSRDATGDARPADGRHEGGESANGPSGANPGIVSRLARVSLRPPAPLPEGSRLDSDTSSSSASSKDTIDSERGSPSPAQDVESTGAKNVVAQPILQDKGKKDMTSFEGFSRARAAGRELAQRNKEAAGLGSANEEGSYYKPKIGDYVMGIVASGNFSKLDVNIGAKELGHLFRKDVMPLDNCIIRDMSWEFPDTNSPESNGAVDSPHGLRVVRDDDVLNLAIEAPMAVELGTVLTVEVKGVTPSGRALLSARSVAREYAWQRVRQLHECNAILEVEITEWTTAGLVSKVEGLRAFLPIYYLVNHAPQPATSGSVCYKEYVGQKFTVMISSVDEKRSNLVISEKKAWMTKNAYIGALVEGIVTGIQPYGVHIRMKSTDMSGVLHISNISRARVNNIASVFTIGEEVKVMVVPSSKSNRLSFSTVELENEHGLILRDKEAVFQDAGRIAAEIAKAYESKQSESALDKNDNVDLVGQKRVIANWDWLDFGEETELDQ